MPERYNIVAERRPARGRRAIGWSGRDEGHQDYGRQVEHEEDPRHVSLEVADRFELTYKVNGRQYVGVVASNSIVALGLP